MSNKAILATHYDHDVEIKVYSSRSEAEAEIRRQYKELAEGYDLSGPPEDVEVNDLPDWWSEEADMEAIRFAIKEGD